MARKSEHLSSYTLGLYEKAMPPGLTFKEMLESTSRCGFDRLEISIDETDERLSRLDWPEGRINELANLSCNLNVPIRTMCLSGHRRFPFGSHDPRKRDRSIDIMRKAVDFAAQVGVAVIQLAGYDVYYEQADANTRAFFEENLAYAVEYAAQFGVILAFETMETAFMDTVTKAMVYVDKINSPYLGVYPDIGNLKNAAVVYHSDLLADIKTGYGHIFAAHLKETQPGVYRDMRFGTGHTPYFDCIQLLWSMGVRMFTAEFWYDRKTNDDGIIADAAVFLRQYLDKIAQ